MSTNDSYQGHLGALGNFIRSQRRLAQLSLRDLAERTQVSNPYLSQIERGLHEPSVRVLKAIAMALDLSAETLLFQAGLLDEAAGPEDGPADTTPGAIRADPRLTDEQKQALLAVYHSYLAANHSRRLADDIPNVDGDATTDMESDSATTRP